MIVPKALLEDEVESTDVLRVDEFIAVGTVEYRADRCKRFGKRFVHQTFILNRGTNETGMIALVEALPVRLTTCRYRSHAMLKRINR